MPTCPKCNASITSAAARCSHCGASLTQRYAREPLVVGVAPTNMGGASSVQAAGRSGWVVVAVALLVVGVASVVGVRLMTQGNVVEVVQGISVTLPDGWKKVRTSTNQGVTMHAYRGEPTEKVALNLMARRGLPAELRSQARQSEALLAMVGAVISKDQALPTVIDLSHGDVIHVQTTIDDTAILGKPSAELALDDFKHLCLGTIIRGGDFIHYEVAFDEPGEVYQAVIQSMNTVAWSR